MPPDFPPQVPPQVPPPIEAGFEHDLRAAMTHIGAAFAELLQAIGADASRPQEVSRRFGINRNLSWKLSKMVFAEEPSSVVGHLPGSNGLRILLDTCRRHGASENVCTRVELAMERFEEMVARHAGDRAGLDVLLSSLAGDQGEVDAQESSRRQAFLGNAAIWGVQARLQLGVLVHVPSASEPGAVDAAAVGGLLGFQRLRETAAWPLVRHQAYRTHPARRDAGVLMRPLDPDIGPDAPPLVREFSSVDAGSLEAVSVTAGSLWELREGPVGLTGTVDCVFGRYTRGIGRQLAEADGERSAAAMVPLNTPTEGVLIDLLVHRDLAYADVVPVPELRSRMETGADAELDGRRLYRLPAPGRVIDLGMGPPALDCEDSPRQAELVAWTLARLGHSLDDFRGWRLRMSYPPIPSAPMLRIALPDAADV